MNTATTQPAANRNIPRAAVEQLAGPMMLSEDRIRALYARLLSVPRDAYSPDSEPNGCEPAGTPKGYSVKHGIARIDVCGVLTKYPLGDGWDEWCGLCPAMPLMETLARAMADWTVRGVTWVIDSPGGMVAGTNMLAEAIAAANKIKPQYGIVSDLAASGGYYLASQCQSISCNAMGEVGCIGVYCVLADWSKFYEGFGVTLTVVSSGGVKGLGADGRVSQELIDDQQRGISGMYEKFIADVATGRGITNEEARKLGDGRCWIAPDALKLGLIDSVASVEDAVAAASMEVQRMNAEQFKAYAASNPDAAEVKALVESGYNKAKADLTPKAATIGELEAVAPGDSAFVLEQAKAGATLAAATAAYCGKLRADLAAKDKTIADAAAAHKAEMAEKDKAIEKAKFEAGGQRPIGTGDKSGGGNAGAEAPGEDPGHGADPKARKEWANKAAAHEWDTDESVRAGFSSRDRYVGYRANQLLGRIRAGKPGAGTESAAK